MKPTATSSLYKIPENSDIMQKKQFDLEQLIA